MGIAIAARMPMIAMTIISSMRVKPRWLPRSRRFFCQNRIIGTPPVQGMDIDFRIPDQGGERTLVLLIQSLGGRAASVGHVRLVRADEHDLCYPAAGVGE